MLVLPDAWRLLARRLFGGVGWGRRFVAVTMQLGVVVAGEGGCGNQAGQGSESTHGVSP